MAESKDERKARLEAELRAIETENREAQIAEEVKDVSLPDVLAHLVSHSTGYPTGTAREVHARAVRQHFGTGEYAAGPDESDGPAGSEPAGTGF